ncbi:MAG: DUF1800 domain-containing protein [Planctomycetes bacterium]|nr:DUF1800 domain-containing protein [Planctomycetota bacterium]
MIDWTYDSAAHLLRRAGFGAPRKEVAAALKRGQVRTVDSLLKFKPSSDRFSKLGDTADATRWWLARMASGKAPLHEKLVLFWHGHFATTAAKVEDITMLSSQNAMFRRLAKASFRELLTAVSQDPAMIFFLDNIDNHKDAPNENYARELMELFSLGVVDLDGNANYTQNDVRELARCFTGWSTSNRRFFFDRNDHDIGVKTVLGLQVAGNEDAQAVIAHLAASRTCALFIAKKLWTFFAYPNPERALLDDLADVYLAGDTSIEALLRAIFLRDEFYSARARTEHVSSPVEFTVGALRTLGAKVRYDDLPYRLSDMGQELFNPPNVAGWPGGLSWMNSVTRFHRMRTTWDIVSGRAKDATFRPDVTQFVTKLPRGAGAAQTLDRIVETLGVAATETTKDELVAYMNTQAEGDPVPFNPKSKNAVDQKVRGAVGVLLTLPEAYLA